MGTLRRLAACGALMALLAPSACSYRVEHRLPMDATFGNVRGETAARTPFENRETRRFLLGGLVPWRLIWPWGEEDDSTRPGRRIERLDIRTEFGPVDFLLKFVPYASYLLAQRSVEVRGVYVDPLPTADAD